MEGGSEGSGEGRGGAGGKTTRRLLARKPSAATPYDRPRPSSEVGAPRERVWREGDEGGVTGWFSKAKQLLRPPSRVLPPFFSPFVAPPSPSPSEGLQSPDTSAAPPLEVEQDSHVDITKQAFNSQASHLDETRSPAADDHPKDYSEVGDDAGGRSGNTYNQIGFADIEKRLKQKTFSRDESNCLIELLRSRTVGLAEDDRYEGFRASNIGNAWDQKYLRRSIEETKPVQMDLRVQKERVFDEAGTSPVEIAKAFMESRSSALHHVPRGGILGADKIPSCDHDSLNSSSVLVARTPQTCWPGAVVQADHRFFTQSQRDRSTLYNVPQNTFSQGSFQKSISKFHCSSERHPSLPFTGCWKQSATPIFGTKERMPDPGDGRTAVPPILGWEHENITSSSKGVTPYHSANSKLLLSTRSDALQGCTSNIQRNVEPSSSRCDIVKHKPACAENDSLRTASGSFRVHPRSTEVARKILEHLDRTVPSPQNELFESKVPVVKRTLPSASMTKMLNGQDNKHCTGFPNAIFLRGDDVSSGDAKAQKAKEEVSLSFKNNVTDSERLQMQKSLPLCQSFGTERAFTTISVSKPENASCFPDNSFGLSFRAFMAPSTYCEPLATQTLDQHASATGGTNPSFDFGPVVGSGPIFSFGSIISSTSIRVADSSVPPYRFGSDDNSRLSFRSFSNDAVCY